MTADDWTDEDEETIERVRKVTRRTPWERRAEINELQRRVAEETAKAAAEAAEKANPQAAVSIYLFIYLLFLISHYIISHTEGLIFIPFLCFSPASISNFTISGCFSA